jgi:preprotein translocase subunit SecA
LNFNFVVVNVGKEILLVEADTNTIVSGNMQ